MRDLSRFRKGNVCHTARRAVGWDFPFATLGDNGEARIEPERHFTPTATRFVTPPHVFVDLDANGQREVFDSRD